MRTPFINPAVILSEELAPSDITPANYCTSAKGIFASEGRYPTTKEDMDAAIASYTKVCDTKSLALFFHGGLVSLDSGMNQTARLLLAPYSSDGSAYPYFFLWESSLVETLVQNLPDIAGDVIFKQILAIVGGKAGRNLGATMPALAQNDVAMFATSLAHVAPSSPATFTQVDVDDVQKRR